MLLAPILLLLLLLLLLLAVATPLQIQTIRVQIIRVRIQNQRLKITAKRCSSPGVQLDTPCASILGGLGGRCAPAKARETSIGGM